MIALAVFFVLGFVIYTGAYWWGWHKGQESGQEWGWHAGRAALHRERTERVNAILDAYERNLP